MRQISNVNKDSPVRIVGLCTSLANAKDLGEWIGASAHGLFNFPPGPSPPTSRPHLSGCSDNQRILGASLTSVQMLRLLACRFEKRFESSVS